jgi:nicotinamide-nucleotide amidase
MRAEIVAVGTELLLGDATDTNSAWLSARLAEIGAEVVRHTAVGDDVETIRQALAEACGRAEAVIVTGGLGPTQDDLTRDAVAALAGLSLERRADLVEYIRGYFASRRREMPERNLVQADLPVGARMLAPVGTAAGFAVEVGAGGGEAVVYCLPGVPAEMRTMGERDVVPDIAARGGLATTVSRFIRTAGMSESAVADAAAALDARLAAERLAGRPAAALAYLASRGETRVRVTATASDRAAALALVDPVVDELVRGRGAGVAGLDDEGVEHLIARTLRDRGWTLALAESVTAGGVCARLARVPGASDWLRGGLVTYQSEAKRLLAGVPAALIDRAGPVSEDLAAALATGARDRLGADVGSSVVGVAGPTTQGGQPVGTVCVAAVLPEGAPQTRTVRLPGRGRVETQEFAASVALDHLRRRLARAG